MSTPLKIYEDEAEKAYRAARNHDRWLEKNRHKKPWLKYAAHRKAWAKANPERIKAQANKNNRQQRLKHWGESDRIDSWIVWVKTGRSADWMMQGWTSAPGLIGNINHDEEWPNDAEEWDGCTDDIIWAAESYGRGLGRYDLLAIACELRLIRDAEEKAGMSAGKRSNESMAQITAVIRNGEILPEAEYQRDWRTKQKGKAA